MKNYRALESNPYRPLRKWWLEPNVVWGFVLYIGCGGLMIYWVSFREQKIGYQAMMFFWLAVLPFVIWLFKRSIYESVNVNEAVIARTQADLVKNRARVRKEFIRRELVILEKGERSPVLDFWRLDKRLRKWHPFFKYIETILVDPAKREFHLRILIPELKGMPTGAKGISHPFVCNVAHFLHIIISDPYFQVLRKFFDRLVLEAYSISPYELREDTSVPVFSILTEVSMLTRHIATARTWDQNIGLLGDVRFDNGAEIQPHRWIPAPKKTSK